MSAGQSRGVGRLVHRRSVELLVAAHDNVEGLAAQHHAVLERVEFGRRRDEGGVLALDAHLFLDAHVVAAVLERLVDLVVGGCTRAAKR